MPGVGPNQILLLGSQSTATGVITGVTATGVSIPIERASGAGVVTLYMRSTGTMSAGTILIEEADWMPREVPYSGTWSVLQTIAATDLTGTIVKAYHITDTCYGYIRVRVSVEITGGGTLIAIARTKDS